MDADDDVALKNLLIVLEDGFSLPSPVPVISFYLLFPPSL